MVWKNILNFSTEQPSCKLLLSILVLQPNATRHTLIDFFIALSWNSLLIYIRNLKKSGSNEVVKENSSDKNSARPSEIITEGKQKQVSTLSMISTAGESGPLPLRQSPTPDDNNHNQSAEASVTFTTSTEILLTPCNFKETLIF